MWYSDDHAQPRQRPAAAQQTEAALRREEEPDSQLRQGFHMVASAEDFPEVMDWRHLALNVVRGQAASFYLNGQPQPSSPRPMCRHWKAPCSSWARMPRIPGSMNCASGRLAQREPSAAEHVQHHRHRRHLQSRPCGLLSLREEGKDNGVPTKVQTLENMAHPSALSGLPAVIDTTLATSRASHRP